MSRSLNKVELIGNLGSDPEIRSTPTGGKVANFSLATSRTWNDQSGVRQEKTEWHRIVVWNTKGQALADLIESYVRKGDKLYIEGRLEYRQWTDKDGQTRYSTEINAREIILLGGKRDGGEGESVGDEGGEPAARPARSATTGAATRASTAASSAANSGPQDGSACPKCGGAMWDNRQGKRNPKAPDFKCKDRDCDGVIWPPRDGSSRPAPAMAGAAGGNGAGNGAGRGNAAPPPDFDDFPGALGDGEDDDLPF